MSVWAYVFITLRHPKRLLPKVRSIVGVVHADALLGNPDIIAIVVGDNINLMDEVIDRIAELEDRGCDRHQGGLMELTRPTCMCLRPKPCDPAGGYRRPAVPFPRRGVMCLRRTVHIR